MLGFRVSNPLQATSEGEILRLVYAWKLTKTAIPEYLELLFWCVSKYRLL